MSTKKQPPPGPRIQDWSQAARVEPAIRIGVVLDEDARDVVHLSLASPGAHLQSDTHDLKLDPGAALEVRRDPESLSIRAGDHPPMHLRQCRIVSTPAETDAGGINVRDVIAGRGFHWQKTIDQVLPGVVELQGGARGVIVINEVPLETYLAGVITAEMSGDCPPALLQAQCVGARSWLLAMTERKHASEPFDRCNDDCCQRYQGIGTITSAAHDAVTASRGVALISAGGQLVDANYAKCCGGVSETPMAVWGIDKPGLGAVVDAPADDPLQRLFPVDEQNLAEFIAGVAARTTQAYCSPHVVPPETFGKYLGRVDDAGDYFRWKVRVTAAELHESLRRYREDFADVAAVRDLRVTRRGVSGRAVELAVDWIDDRGRGRRSTLRSEYDIRAALHAKFLLSSAFLIDVERDERGNVAAATLHGAGWGHGAGLCQIGALGMALRGHGFEEILRHYYPGATLQAVYS